jgi:hypothetical protein
MNWIKKLFRKKTQKQCAISGVRRSNIKTYCGDKYEISRAYENLVNKENIHITSVSVTRVDHDGGRGYVDNYMIAISYDYYT